MQVDFIYEPPQQGSAVTLCLERLTSKEEQVDFLAGLLGYQKVWCRFEVVAGCSDALFAACSHSSTSGDMELSRKYNLQWWTIATCGDDFGVLHASRSSTRMSFGSLVPLISCRQTCDFGSVSICLCVNQLIANYS